MMGFAALYPSYDLRRQSRGSSIMTVEDEKNEFMKLLDEGHTHAAELVRIRRD
jgi:hypothetical protein